MNAYVYLTLLGLETVAGANSVSPSREIASGVMTRRLLSSLYYIIHCPSAPLSFQNTPLKLHLLLPMFKFQSHVVDKMTTTRTSITWWLFGPSESCNAHTHLAKCSLRLGLLSLLRSSFRFFSSMQQPSPRSALASYSLQRVAHRANYELLHIALPATMAQIESWSQGGAREGCCHARKKAKRGGEARDNRKPRRRLHFARWVCVAGFRWTKQSIRLSVRW